MDEREKFESWMKAGGLDETPRLSRDKHGYYVDWDVQRAWRGWQGCSAQQAKGDSND